jgi:hypothetical protein
MLDIHSTPSNTSLQWRVETRRRTYIYDGVRFFPNLVLTRGIRRILLLNEAIQNASRRGHEQLTTVAERPLSMLRPFFTLGSDFTLYDVFEYATECDRDEPATVFCAYATKT